MKNDIAFLSIYNANGQLLNKEEFGEGTHNYKWNAENYCSGIYYYTLESESYKETKKMTLLR